MLRPKESSNGSLAKIQAKLELQIKQLGKDIKHPPSKEADQSTWIKERAREVKDLLKLLLNQPEGIKNKFELLDELSGIRQQLSDMNKLRRVQQQNQSKRSISGKRRNNTSQHSKSKSRISDSKQSLQRNPSIIKNKKSKSSKSNIQMSKRSKSQNSLSINTISSKRNEKSLSKGKNKKKAKESHQTPYFKPEKKSKTLITQMRSFSKNSNKSSEKRNKSEKSVISKKSDRSFASKSFSEKSKKKRNRSKSSSKILNDFQERIHNQYKDGIKNSPKKVGDLPSSYSVQQSFLNGQKSPLVQKPSRSQKISRKQQIKKLLDTSSSMSKQSLKREKTKRKQSKKESFSQSYHKDQSSQSISMAGELKETLPNIQAIKKISVLRPSNSFGEKEMRDKFKQYLNTEKFQKDEDQLIELKFDSLSKEKIIKEYKILYLRNKEVKQLLQEYFNTNADIVEQIEQINQKNSELQNELKLLRKEKKEISKANDELLIQLDKAQRDIGSAYKKSTREIQSSKEFMEQINILKRDNDKLNQENHYYENLVYQLEKDMKELRESIVVYKNRDMTVMQMGKGNKEDHFYKSQRETEIYKEQSEKQREELILARMQMEKEQNMRIQLENQVQDINDRCESEIQQKNQEIQQLRTQLQVSQTKIQTLENQISLLKFQENTYHDSTSNLKEQIKKLEESSQITSLRMENREKELQESKQNQLNLKKRVLELESQLQNSQIKQVQLHQDDFSIRQLESQKINALKDLQTEKLQNQKSQQEIYNLMHENEGLKIDIKDLENRLRVDQNEIQELRFQFQQIQNDYKNRIDSLSSKLKDEEDLKQKDIKSRDQLQKNQDIIISSQQQRISELENDLKNLQYEYQSLNTQSKQYDQRLSEYETQNQKFRTTNQDYFQQIRLLQQEKDDLQKQLSKIIEKNQELEDELDELDRMRENYKTKYLSTKFENRKYKQDFTEKENMMRTNYQTELERIKIEKETLEKQKQQEDQVRQSKSKKLKVISEIQSIIKEHRSLI